MTGTVSRNIAGRQVGTGYLSQRGHIYSLVTLWCTFFRILCICGHSQVVVAGVIHHVLLCALLFCLICLTLLARQRKPVSVPRHRSPVQMVRNLSNQSFTHGHSGRSFCLFWNRKKKDSSVYLEMFTFEFSCFAKLLMYLKLTVISFSWVPLSELKYMQHFLVIGLSRIFKIRVLMCSALKMPLLEILPAFLRKRKGSFHLFLEDACWPGPKQSSGKHWFPSKCPFVYTVALKFEGECDILIFSCI